MKRILEWLLYIDEDQSPENTMRAFNRRWRYWPAVGHWNGRVYLGLQLQLIQFKGELYDKPTVAEDFQLQFIYDPRKWKIGQEHMYYDGPHCIYDFGPFAIYRHWGWCLKCMPADGNAS